MSFDRAEFKKFSEDQNAGRVKSQIPHLRALMAVAPRMEALTHDEKWDTYCAYLTGIKEKLEAAKNGAQVRLNSPAVVNNDEMMTQKIALLVNEAQIQMIDLALELPKALLDGADDAKRLVEKFEQDNSSG